MSISSFGILGELSVPLALGLLRLSTEGRPDHAAAIKLIHEALDAGIRVLDTADSYCLHERDLHYGETLAAEALRSWSGSRNDVRILTKVGMTRPKGRWLPNAKPAHIRKAVEGSLRALGVEQLYLLQLHAPDPSTPFAAQLEMLRDLQAEGKVLHLGLCNVDVPEIRQAHEHFTVAAIQNELSVMNRKAATEGTLALAKEIGAVFLAHRPLGGHAKVDTLEKNRAMQPIAVRHRITKPQAALATLHYLGAPVLPIVGATKSSSLQSSLAALKIAFDAQDSAAISSKISFEMNEAAFDQLEKLPPAVTTIPNDSDPQIVIIMGPQGAGKSSLVERYTQAGFGRLNRDQQGGSLDDLLPHVNAALGSDNPRVVLDNTYGTWVSRWPLLRLARARGVPVVCHYLNTPASEALTNIVLRVWQRYGKLLGPDELKEFSKTDGNLPPPAALAKFFATFEAPSLSEGFAKIDETHFQRDYTHGLNGRQKALLLDVDGTLRVTKSGEPYPTDPNDIEILPGRREKLLDYIARDYQLFLVSNQSGVAGGKLTESDAKACFERTIELLDVPIRAVSFCPHPAFPTSCFCRKPMPGLGIALALQHQLDVRAWIMVGDMESDREFAAAIGAEYHEAGEFFA